MKNFKKENGEILTISMIFVSVAIVIFILIETIFLSHINTVLYNFKIDMYTLNKSAVISINKKQASMDNFLYNKNIFKEEFIKGLKRNYNLNEKLENENKLITKIEVLEYEIFEKNKRDSYTNEKCKNRTLHTVIKLKIKPIIFADFFEDIFTFTIHEDVALNSMIVE